MNTSVHWGPTWLLTFGSIILIIMFGGCGELAGPQTSNKAEAYEIEDLTINDVSGDCEMGTVSAFVENASDSTRYSVSHDSSSFTKSGIVPESGEIVVNVGDKDGKFTFDVNDNAGGETRQAKASATLDCDSDPVGPGSVDLKDFGCMPEDPDQGFALVRATRGFERWRKTNLDTGVVTDSSGFTPEPDQTYRFTDLNDQDYEFELFKGENSGTVQQSPNCDPDPEAPTARFTFDANELEVDFDGSNSSDPDGEIVSYSWEFGDGDTGNGKTTSHTYDTEGTYSVTLTVEDDDGLTDSTTKDLSVNKLIAPTADFTFDADELSVDFDGSPSSDEDGTIESYDWDFGDGSTDSGIQPTHTYDEPGTYEVTLTVTDDDGLTDSVTKEVTVDEMIPPTAKFTFERDTLKVNFDASDSFDPDGEIASYSWEFGDGTTGSGVSPMHMYPESGYYDVTLTIEDDDGLTDNITKTVYVEKIVKCTCTFDLKAGDLFVAGKEKFELQELTNGSKEVIPGQPTSDWIRIQIWVRLSQEDQFEENFAKGFLPDASGDSLWTDIVYDKDNTGSGERWVLVTIETSSSFLEVGKLYSGIAAHSHYFGEGDMDGLDSVWFRDDEGTSLNFGKSTQSSTDDEALAALKAENNADSRVVMPKSFDPGFTPDDHVFKVEVEMLDSDCPDDRQ